MKVVIFDPQLSRSGHHVSFNTQVLSLISSIFSEVIFIDISDCIGENLQYENVLFKNLKWSDIGKNDNSNVSVDDYKNYMAKAEFCSALLGYIDSLNPDFVIFTSEGSYRTSLYSSLEKLSKRKIYIIVHIIWSFLKTMKDSEKLYAAMKNISGTLVLEPFLTKHIKEIGLKCDWFPLRSYTNEYFNDVKNSLSNYTTFGTVGVINERRNNNFIINSFKYVENDNIKYILAGDLRDTVKFDVLKSVSDVKLKTNIQIETKFGYIEDDVFYELLGKLNYGILAYDSERNLQASAAVYSYTEAGVPLIVPKIDLFIEYAFYYPGLFIFYNPLDIRSLAGTIKQLTRFDKFSENKFYSSSRKAFLRINSFENHKDYLTYLFV